MKICTKCVYDESIPYITFDENGVCKYCHQLEKLKKEHPEYIVDMDIKPVDGHEVIDSSTRYGYCLMSAKDLKSLYPYLPDDMEE